MIVSCFNYLTLNKSLKILRLLSHCSKVFLLARSSIKSINKPTKGGTRRTNKIAFPDNVLATVVHLPIAVKQP